MLYLLVHNSISLLGGTCYCGIGSSTCYLLRLWVPQHFSVILVTLQARICTESDIGTASSGYAKAPSCFRVIQRRPPAGQQLAHIKSFVSKHEVCCPNIRSDVWCG